MLSGPRMQCLEMLGLVIGARPFRHRSGHSVVQGSVPSVPAVIWRLAAWGLHMRITLMITTIDSEQGS